MPGVRKGPGRLRRLGEKICRVGAIGLAGLLLCAATAAEARVTFGVVPGGNSLIRSQAQAELLARYLEDQLGEEVAVRSFQDPKVLHDWLSRFREVDLAVLPLDYVRRQPAGEFFYLASLPQPGEGRNGLSDPVVARQGVTAEFRARLQQVLRQIPESDQGRALLAGLGRGAPEPVAAKAGPKVKTVPTPPGPATAPSRAPQPAKPPVPLKPPQAISPSAYPLTLGLVPGEAGIGWNEGDARLLADRLAQMLGRPVAVRVFQDPRVLYDWLHRYRQVDLALLPEADEKTVATGTFYPVATLRPATPSGRPARLVLRQGLAPGLAAALQKALAEPEGPAGRRPQPTVAPTVARPAPVAPIPPAVPPAKPLRPLPPVTLGMVPAWNTLVHNEAQARQFGAYLQSRLGQEVAVRLFEDEAALYAWLEHNRQLDLAILRLDSFKGARGKVYHLAIYAEVGRPRPGSADLAVVQRGLGNDLLVRIQEILVGMAEDAAGRRLLTDLGVAGIAPPGVSEPPPMVKTPPAPPAVGGPAPAVPEAKAPRRVEEALPPAVPTARVPDPPPTLSEPPAAPPAPAVPGPPTEPAAPQPRATRLPSVPALPAAVQPATAPAPPSMEISPPTVPAPQAPVLAESRRSWQGPVPDPDPSSPAPALPAPSPSAPALPEEPTLLAANLAVSPARPPSATSPVLPAGIAVRHALREPMAQNQVFVVPFGTLMVPVSVAEGVFDDFVDLLNAAGKQRSYEFVILKNGVDTIGHDWLASRTHVTGELFGYVEESDCCSTAIRAKPRIQVFRPNQATPYYTYEYPVQVVFDQGRSGLEAARLTLAHQIAEVLSSQLLRHLDGN